MAADVGPARRYTRVMNDPIKIYLANARLNDPIAMQRLLASPPPDGERETVAGSMRSGPGIGFSYDSAVSWPCQRWVHAR